MKALSHIFKINLPQAHTLSYTTSCKMTSQFLANILGGIRKETEREHPPSSACPCDLWSNDIASVSSATAKQAPSTVNNDASSSSTASARNAVSVASAIARAKQLVAARNAASADKSSSADKKAPQVDLSKPNPDLFQQPIPQAHNSAMNSSGKSKYLGKPMKNAGSSEAFDYLADYDYRSSGKLPPASSTSGSKERNDMPVQSKGNGAKIRDKLASYRNGDGINGGGTSAAAQDVSTSSCVMTCLETKCDA